MSDDITTTTFARLRVLVAIDAFYDGGAEMCAIRLANALSREHCVYFLAWDSHLTHLSLQSQLLAPDVKRVELPTKRRPWLPDRIEKRMPDRARRWLRSLAISERRRALADFVRAERIDAVNTHAPFVTDAVASAISRDTSHCRKVVTLHGHYEYHLARESTTQTHSWIQRQLDACDAIVYTTSDQIATLDRFAVPQSKRHMIWYGVDLPDRKSVSGRHSGHRLPLRLVLVSRAINEKGWREAIEAVNRVNRDGVVATLTLVGGGPVFDELRLLELPAWIRLIGPSDSVARWICDSDVGLLPSYYHAESMPNAVIEYLMWGKPVIASRIGAIPEMISSDRGPAGILIEAIRGTPLNPSALEAAIRSLATQPELLAVLTQRTIPASSKFDMRAACGAYRQLFKQ